MRRPLALTLGEPAGIGPDITFAAWLRRAELKPASLLPSRRPGLRGAPGRSALRPGCRSRWSSRRALVRPSRPRCRSSISACRSPPSRAVPITSSAPAALAAIRRAVADVGAGAACAIVTNPVAKNVLYRSGFTEPGHTEYLAKLAEDMTGVAAHPVMLLWSPELAVVPVTIHLPLKDVAAQADNRAHRRDRPHRRARPARTLRHCAPAAGGRRPQSARRGGRHARRGRSGGGAARGRAAQGRRHRRPRPAAGRHPVPPRGARRPTTSRSRCITTRR